MGNPKKAAGGDSSPSSRLGKKKADVENTEDSEILMMMQKKGGNSKPKKAVSPSSKGAEAFSGFGRDAAEPEQEPRAYCPTPEETVLLENVRIDSKEAETEGSYVSGLLEEMQELAEQIFHEDLLEKIRKSYDGVNPWRLALLVNRGKAKAEHEPEEEMKPGAAGTPGKLPGALLGFIVYIDPRGRPSRTLAILRVAVPSRFRGAGYGKRLTQFAMSHARKLPREECGTVTCSSLQESVAFYQRLGFQEDKNAMLEAEQCDFSAQEDLIPGQVWMKYKLGKPTPKSKTAKRR